MNSRNLLKVSLAFAALLTYAACNQQKEIAGISQLGPSINTPFKNLSPEKTSYRFNPEEKQTLKISTGTVINIPAHAFVDQSGKIVKSQVTIHYEEYHSPAEIILSGIRMTYFDGNEIQNFESAGMFQINAESEGQQLDLAQGKTIEVNMASTRDDNDFKNWYLNQETGNWEDLGESLSEANIEKALLEESIAKLENNTIEAPQVKSKFYIDFSRFKVQNYSADAMNQIIWVYEPSNKAIDLDPEQNLWIFDEQWTETLLKAENDGKHYKASLIGKNKRFDTRVKPANEDHKAIKKALEDHKKQVEERNRQLTDAKLRMEKMQKFQRSFTLANMGVYNCDRYYRMPNVVASKIKITLEGDDVASDFNIYQICNNNAVIQIFPGQTELKYSPTESVKFVLVDNEDKIAVINANEFNRMKSSINSKMKLDFKYIPTETAFSESAFADLIQNL
jgi:hypothetical protein